MFNAGQSNLIMQLSVCLVLILSTLLYLLVQPCVWHLYSHQISLISLQTESYQHLRVNPVCSLESDHYKATWDAYMEGNDQTDRELEFYKGCSHKNTQATSYLHLLQTVHKQCDVLQLKVTSETCLSVSCFCHLHPSVVTTKTAFLYIWI